MEWTRYIDGYCERIDPGYWSEPINAVSNASFLIAAFVMWRRVRGRDLPLAMVLISILAAIGIGSYLFHTHATAWAAMADVVPIGGFILAYLFAVNRDFLGWPFWGALAGAAAFLPYAAAVAPVFAALPFFAISGFYWVLPVLILIYAFVLRERAPGTARGLAVGAAILIVSITLRSLDMPLCDRFPAGTHSLWHVFNGLMLGWMIEVYRRHMLEGAGAER
ncbi:MAG: ceramidase domain-containing protein [Pseudomonadota bacterium]